MKNRLPALLRAAWHRKESKTQEIRLSDTDHQVIQYPFNGIFLETMGVEYKNRSPQPDSGIVKPSQFANSKSIVVPAWMIKFVVV